MRLAPPFSDHAVLQRDQPIPVWGVAAPDEVVTVTCAGTTARVMSGVDGAWLVRLPPQPAGGPHELVATSPSGMDRAVDLLIGEVWLCSGQSNMEWKLGQTPHGLSAEDAEMPALRLLTVSSPARLGRQTRIDGTWHVASRESMERFSAVGAWFGRAIHQALGVPVGLICNAWGGTRVQAWMSREALVRDPLGLDEVRAYEAYAYTDDIVSLPNQTDWEAEARRLGADNRGLAAGWAGSGFDDSGWSTMRVPAQWQSHGHPGSGVFWFRRSLRVPAEWAGRDLELHLGAIDKHDDTYVGGERVGGLSWEDGGDTWCRLRTYRVPGRLVAGGQLTVAVRVRSHIYHGGLLGPAEELRLHPVDEPQAAIALAGDWPYAIEQDWGVRLPPTSQQVPGSPNAPYTLFDSRLAPLIPYGLRGCIWYQGESNASQPAVYRRLLPQMIADWRRAFGQGDFTFLQVQLANFMPVRARPQPSDWAELRDAQAATALADPAGGFAVAIDVGDTVDIHPRDKRPVGERLARWALATTYGRNHVPCGPLYDGCAIEAGGRVRIRFRHGECLRTRDGGPPRHVAIAGADRAFVWAETVLENGTLVAWHASVPRPAAVRYAWADNPEGCNLIGTDGLPAAPFRTDAW